MSKNYLYEFRTRRVRRSFAHEGCKFTEPEHVAEFLLELTRELDREHFYALYLDARGGLIGFEVVSIGGMAGVEVHPREVFRGAMLAGAFALIVAHNHPSGDPTPSAEDYALTKRLKEAGDIVGIPVYDHIVVAPGVGMHSMAQQGGF